MLIAALVGLSLVATVAALIAFSAYRRARENEIKSRRISYVANMNLAGNEFERGNFIRGQELLNQFLPASTVPQRKLGQDGQALFCRNG
jgi:hypothetical protein